jgi:hypothetical protein
MSENTNTDSLNPDLRRNRADAMTGTLATIVTAHALRVLDMSPQPDSYRDSSEIIAKFMDGWNEGEHDFRTVTDAVLGLNAILRQPIHTDGVPSMLSAVETPFSNVTPEQQQDIDTFFHYDDFGMIVYDGVDAQISITAAVAFPGYISAKFGLNNAEELKNVLSSMQLNEAYDIMLEDTFVESLVLMSIARNGTYEMTPSLVDPGSLTDDYIEDIEAREYLGNAQPIEPIHDLVIQVAKEQDVSLDIEKPSFSIYELYENIDGVTQLSRQFVQSARQGIQLTSKYGSTKLQGQENDDISGGLSPTIGCPVARKTFSLDLDELSPDQSSEIQHMSDEGLVTVQNGRVKLEKTVIEVLHRQLMSEFKKYIDSQAA